MATFDLNILPIHRINGQELAELPGLFALAPPRKTARGREKDNLIGYLMLAGNATFTAEEVEQLTDDSAKIFYQSAGSLTSAMRKMTESINSALLARNLSTTGRGRYALGLLALSVVREDKCTLLLSGPTHAVWVSEGQSRHIHDPALSGRGLGSSQNIQMYLSQVDLHSNDLLALCGKFPRDWEADLLNERPPASLDASYRKLTFTKGDLNAALVQAQSGHGIITILRPEVPARPSDSTVVPVVQELDQTESFTPKTAEVNIKPMEDSIVPMEPVESTEDNSEHETLDVSEEELDAMADLGAHMVQPSAYAIPPRPEELFPSQNEETSEPAIASSSTTSPRSFPPSIPRAKPAERMAAKEPEEAEEGLEDVETEFIAENPDKPSAHAEAARQMAKVMVSGIQTGRRVNERLGEFMRRFLPRLFPNTDSTQPLVVPTYAMVSIAIIIPVLVAVSAWVIYDKYGLSERFRELYQNALVSSAQAASETDPSRQRDDLLQALDYLNQAEDYRETNETRALRADAQSKYDNLMGIQRLEFIPAFANGLGSSTQITRLAASESDVYMLDAESGKVVHAVFTGRTLELDSAFNCQPGTYGGYQVGTLVDILALPKVNAFGATVLGIDTSGNLLYCAPGQVPQAFPLPALPNTNWGRITAFVLDSNNLYILDSAQRAVWVYVGKNSAFLDPPYFYFGNQIPDNIGNAIDLAVSGDDLYMLHSDGHLSTCTFSRIDEVPTRCTDPATYQDNLPAHKDFNVFAQAHFTQMTLTAPPNTVILLLDSENRSVFRFSPRSLELQNQITSYAGRASPFQLGRVSAMAVSPNYVLYLAIGNQVYFATNLP